MWLVLMSSTVQRSPTHVDIDDDIVPRLLALKMSKGAHALQLDQERLSFRIV